MLENWRTSKLVRNPKSCEQNTDISIDTIFFQKKTHPANKQLHLLVIFLFIFFYFLFSSFTCILIENKMCCCGIINTSEIGIIESWGKFARVSDVRNSLSSVSFTVFFLHSSCRLVVIV
jgi:hypothetical protein